jgi:hypothetical protein
MGYKQDMDQNAGLKIYTTKNIVTYCSMVVVIIVIYRTSHYHNLQLTLRASKGFTKNCRVQQGIYPAVIKDG